MTTPFHALLLLIAGATQKELARHVKYLKVENEILRSKLGNRVTVTPKEKRRLAKFGAKLGKALRQLVTIVHPSTLLRWINEEQKSPKKLPTRRGRKRTPEYIRKLVIKLARENDWGYTRILGELKKLGICSISKNTVKNILKEKGLDPGPKRGEGTWDDFLKRHAVSLWQCDFFSWRVLTMTGIKEVFVLAFLHVKTRQVILSPATFHPNEEWVVQQASTFVEQARAKGLRVAQVQRDRDTKFTKSFDKALKRSRVKVRIGSIRSPNTNAYVERFIQSIGQECLDHFVILGEKHMDHLCCEYLEYYHQERPHQGMKNEVLTKLGRRRGMPVNQMSLTEVRGKQRLGGLLKSYSRAA